MASRPATPRAPPTPLETEKILQDGTLETARGPPGVLTLRGLSLTKMLSVPVTHYHLRLLMSECLTRPEIAVVVDNGWLAHHWKGPNYWQPKQTVFPKYRW